MSYLGTYYRDFHGDGNSHLLELYDVIEAAAKWVETSINERYGSSRTPIQLDEMPGYDLGFRPVELQVFKKTNKEPLLRKVDSCPIWNEPEYKYINAFGGECGAVKATSALAESLNKKTGLLFLVQDNSEYALPIKMSWLQQKFIPQLPKETGEVYVTVMPAKYTYVPLLYSLELGEMYYFYVDSLKVFKRGSGKVSIQLGGGNLVAVNWITGKISWVGYEVAWKGKVELFQPDQYEEIKEEHAEYKLNAIMRAKWEFIDEQRRKKNPARRKTSLYEQPDDVVEKIRKESEEERDMYFASHPFPRLEKLAVFDEEMAKKSDYGCRYSSVLKSISRIDVTSFLEVLYELPCRSLYLAPYKENAGTNMVNFLWTLRYTGNLFQSVLQTTSFSPWFLSMLLNSISGGGKPMDPSIRSLPQWFGLTKPEFKALLSEPSGNKFVFSLGIRQLKPYSLKDCERLYARVVRECEENDMSCTDSAWRYCSTMSTIRGKYGRVLLRTTKLPRAVGLYMSENLQKSIPVTDFIKYMSQEIVPGHPQVGTLMQVWSLLKDYNRMAKEVIPSCGFVLPHHILPAHDSMVNNYNQIKADKLLAVKEAGDNGLNVDELNAFEKCYSGKPADVYSDATFIMRAPESGMDLYEEGIILNHCVGAYTDAIISARGSMLIYFLRKANQPDNPLVTVQINRSKEKTSAPFYLFEIAGKGNRLPTDAEKKFAEDWLEHLNAYIIEKKKATGSLQKALVDSYDKEIINWLTVLGVPVEVLPDYDGTVDVDRNYIRLFDAAACGLTVFAANQSYRLDIDNLKKQVSKFCKRLRLSNEAASAFMGLVDSLSSPVS